LGHVVPLALRPGVTMTANSELTMTHFSGVTYRDVIDFSQCDEYRGESTINFDH
jgi:hypothetical protein